MKAKFTSLLTMGVMAFVMTSCYAQSYTYANNGYDREVSVQATSADISYNLDLRAVANVFADSRNLEQFERRLNDYNEGINNLDLNQDGRVDYLRVIETSRGNNRLVVIQAVLDRDVYQDVASIVLERRWNSRTYVQVIGDPFVYGPYYIIEPVYVYTPPIFSFFWGPSYVAWRSPYYWGYYPSYYSYYNPRPVNVYVNNINIYVDKSRNTYNYSDRIRSNEYSTMRSEVSRSDFERRNPDRSFANRNPESRVSNRRDLGDYTSRSRSSSSVDMDNRRSSGTRDNWDSRTSGRMSTDNSTRSSSGVDANRSARSREEWNSVRQSRSTGDMNNNTPTRTRQDANTGSRTSRESYGNRENNSGTATQPTRTRTNDDVYSRPSRSSSESGTYSSPSRTTNSSSSRSSDTYGTPGRSRSSDTYSRPSRSSSEDTYSRPSRSSSSDTYSTRERSSAPARNETYSPPSRSSETYSVPSRSSESSSSRSSSSDGGGRSSSGRR